MDFTLLALFFLTFSSLLALPGPNTAFIVAQSLKYGFSSTIIVPLGFMVATGIHAIFIFSGLGIVIQSYTGVLIILKWLGVIYLLFLAFHAFSDSPSIIKITPKAISKSKMFFSAMLISLTNPKEILANIIIYPMFISSEYSYSLQAIVLLLSAMVISFSVYSFYGFIALKFKNYLSATRLGNKIVGGIYLVAAGALLSKSI